MVAWSDELMSPSSFCAEVRVEKKKNALKILVGQTVSLESLGPMTAQHGHLQNI